MMDSRKSMQSRKQLSHDVNNVFEHSSRTINERTELLIQLSINYQSSFLSILEGAMFVPEWTAGLYELLLHAVNTSMTVIFIPHTLDGNNDFVENINQYAEYANKRVTLIHPKILEHMSQLTLPSLRQLSHEWVVFKHRYIEILRKAETACIELMKAMFSAHMINKFDAINASASERNRYLDRQKGFEHRVLMLADKLNQTIRTKEDKFKDITKHVDTLMEKVETSRKLAKIGKTKLEDELDAKKKEMDALQQAMSIPTTQGEVSEAASASAIMNKKLVSVDHDIIETDEGTASDFDSSII